MIENEAQYEITKLKIPLNQEDIFCRADLDGQIFLYVELWLKTE